MCLGLCSIDFEIAAADHLLAGVSGMRNDMPDNFEQHREEWHGALAALQKKLTKSQALRKSDAPVSLLQFFIFALQTTVTALPNANANGKMVHASVNFLVGTVKSVVTSDPRAFIQGALTLAGVAWDAMHRRVAEYYCRLFSFFSMRAAQGDLQTLQGEVSVKYSIHVLA